jgi:hypothetical protein
MPRNGDGSGDNAIEAGETLIHGAGDAPNDVCSSLTSLLLSWPSMSASSDMYGEQGKSASGVDRSNKAAPMPEVEEGDSIPGMNASGGGNDVKGSGKGPKESTVDAEAKKE